MTPHWLIAACLACGALILLVRPTGSALRRLRDDRSHPVAAPVSRPRRNRLAVADLPRLAPMLPGAAGGCGLLLGGPVAAVVCAAYAAIGITALRRGARRRRETEARTRSLDDLCALAADLRAGLPPAVASSRAPFEPGSPDRVADLTAAVWRLAERTGAPAADLVERIEADGRAAARLRASAAAEAAGAQATAVLLAALPLGGVALGYSMGVDPLAVLLHTPLGAGCALGAVLLQCAGLAWSVRLVRGAVR